VLADHALLAAVYHIPNFENISAGAASAATAVNTQHLKIKLLGLPFKKK
jgi:hypothetical protein